MARVFARAACEDGRLLLQNCRRKLAGDSGYVRRQTEKGLVRPRRSFLYPTPVLSRQSLFFFPESLRRLSSEGWRQLELPLRLEEALKEELGVVSVSLKGGQEDALAQSAKPSRESSLAWPTASSPREGPLPPGESFTHSWRRRSLAACC